MCLAQEHNAVTPVRLSQMMYLSILGNPGVTHSVPTAFITVGTEWVTPGLPRMVFIMLCTQKLVSWKYGINSFFASGDFCHLLIIFARSGLIECQSWSGSKLFDSLISFQKEFLEKLNFERVTIQRAKFLQSLQTVWTQIRTDRMSNCLTLLYCSWKKITLKCQQTTTKAWKITQHAELNFSTMINVLKFRRLVAPPKQAYKNSVDPDQTASKEAVWSGSFLFTILTTIFLNSSPENQSFIREKKEKSFRNLRTFTVPANFLLHCFMVLSLEGDPHHKSTERVQILNW